MIRLTQFGLVTLPINLPRNVHDLNFVSRAVPGLGGGYDGWGSDRAERELPWPFPYECTVVGANRAALQTTVEALEAQGGARLRLWGVAEDGSLRWAWARLLRIGYDYTPRNLRHIPLTLRFEMWTRGGWYGRAYGGSWDLDAGYYFDSGLYLDMSGATTLDGNDDIVLPNLGNRTCLDVGIAVTAGDNPVTSLAFTVTGLVQFSWAGTLAAGKTLIFDTLTRRVLNDGVGAYGGFARGANHCSPYWLPLAAGNTTVNVVSDGTSEFGTNPNVQFTYSDAWV